MRILLVGYGRMGKLVESLAGEYGCEVAGVVDPLLGGEGVDSDRWAAGRDRRRHRFLVAGRGHGERPAARPAGASMSSSARPAGDRGSRSSARSSADAGIGIVAAPNFSTGVVVFEAVVAEAAKLLAPQNDFGAFLHEAHHHAKKDAPSGTALLLKGAMERAGFPRPIDVSSTRAGYIPGTHTVGFDGPAETITLTHTARDRTAFARGALTAAQWVKGRRGWFTMRDVLGLT